MSVETAFKDKDWSEKFIELKPQDREGERVASIAGLSSQPLNDSIRILTDENGNAEGLIEQFSTDMLEEDLAVLEGHEHILSQEVRERVIRSAFTKVIAEFSPYVPKEKMELLFPGMNPDNIDDYNFSRSNIKVYLLPSTDYVEFEKALHGTQQPMGSEGFAPVNINEEDFPLIQKSVVLNMGAKKLVVVSEDDPNNRYIGPIPPLDKISRMLEFNIEHRIIHELVHKFDIGGEGLPTSFKEGLVEWYTQGIFNGDVTDNDYFKKTTGEVAYRYETEAVSLILTALTESGVSLDTINRAFISHDQDVQIGLGAVLADRYGIDEARRIFNWGYRNGKGALKHILNLEARQDSRLGEFLRTFADKELRD